MATVQELYQQILGREPEPAGLLYWENQFGDQVDPAEVERFQAAAASELAQRQAESAAASPVASSNVAAANVEALYESQLGRAADPGGLAYWTNKFGNEIDANEAAQFQAAAARELAQRSSQQAVEALYASQLGRASDPSGLAYWTNRFGSDIDANELAEFQAAAAREVAARTAGVPPPRVTTPPPTPTPAPTPAPRVTAPPPGTLPPPTPVMQPPVYSGGTGGTFIGGGSPGYTSFMPFSNAGQGLAENFANYQSIPIGSQYNPGVTAGGFSPYEQVMGQMRPLGNPYANVMAGQAMGGYDPALYDQILANNAARAVAANANMTLADYYGSGGGDGDSGDGGGDSGGDGGGNGSGAASGDCVDPDVHILLADRSTVRAGDLKVGDMLHTLHDETFVYGDFPVEYVNILQRPKVEAQFDDGQKIIISITHKFLTADNKWEKISDIEIGTSIRGFGDVTKKLVSITDVGTGPVIEMVVTDAHTYISEGLVSHNKFYGGLITNVSGPDPAGPDEGQVNMMRGEYVIKKSSVNKYGRGLLDMINEGKVPAKKMKSLLG